MKLADDELRERSMNTCGNRKSLAVALSSTRFIEQTLSKDSENM